MKTIGRFFIFLVLLFNVVMLLGLSVHVVKSGRTVKVIAKDHLTLVDTYNDVTNWTVDDAQRHPLLLSRLTETGHADLVSALGNAMSSPQNPYTTLDSMVHNLLKH